MAKLLESDNIVDVEFDDITEQQDDIENEIDNIIADFGDEEVNSMYLKVYRAIPNTGKWEHLFDCLTSELPIQDRLHNEYGGGQYQVRLYIKKELHGKRPKHIMNRKFELFLGEQKKQPVVKSDNKDLITVMIDGFSKLGELIAAQNNTQNFNPMSMQAEMMQNMVAMKEILGLGGKAEKDTIGQLRSLIEVQKMITPPSTGGGADTGDVLLGLMNNVLPHLAEIGKQEQKNVNVRNRKLISRNKKQVDKQQGNNPMKMHLIFLTQMAKRNNDPMTYAKMVLDNTDEEKIPELIEFISGENALNDMGKLHKSVLKYPEWFAELGKNVLELVNEGDYKHLPVNNDIINVPGVTGTQIIVSEK